VRIVADHELARTHQAVVGHHLVRDAGLRVVEAFDAEPVHLMADQRILVGLRLVQRRLMVVEQDEHAVRVPHARQAILEPGLQREIVHRLGGVVMAHRAVDARFDDVARIDRRAARLCRESSFSAMVCLPREAGFSSSLLPRSKSPWGTRGTEVGHVFARSGFLILPFKGRTEVGMGH
jgi:hypothetical protein